MVEYDFFWKIVPYWMYFGHARPGLQANYGMQYYHNQAIKNGLYQAIMLIENILQRLVKTT